jgi:hypothetical protein
MADKTVEQRLDAQARAIRELRSEMKRLRAEIGTSDSRMQEHVSGNLPLVGPLGEPGKFVPSPRCYSCGKDKGPGRRLILCADCGSKRQRAIQHGNTVPRYTSCGNCGKTLNGSTIPLCGKCGPAYRRWRDKG